MARSAAGHDFGWRGPCAVGIEQLPAEIANARSPSPVTRWSAIWTISVVSQSITHLRAAQDDAQVGTQAFEQTDDVEGRLRVPDIDAEPEDARLPGEDGFDDFERGLFDFELQKFGAALEFGQAQEVTQAERRVNEFRVESAEYDVRHGRARENPGPAPVVSMAERRPFMQGPGLESHRPGPMRPSRESSGSNGQA